MGSGKTHFKKILEYGRKANMHLFMKTITKFPLQGGRG
jgi:hypothetical protein